MVRSSLGLSPVGTQSNNLSIYSGTPVVNYNLTDNIMIGDRLLSLDADTQSMFLPIYYIHDPVATNLTYKGVMKFGPEI